MRVAKPSGLDDGARPAEERAAAIDGALLELSTAALGENPTLSVVAVGGYGRGRLSPHSDIDLIFLWTGRVEPDVSKATLRNLLYPLWDSGFRVGHAVTTAKGAIERCKGDLHAATSVLSARMVAGGADAFDELLDRRARWVNKQRKVLVRRVLDARAERHSKAERAGWTLAPDLKDDIGGLRDVDHLEWLIALAGEGAIETELRTAEGELLAAREALHSEVTRKTDRLRIDLQPRVARRLGFDGPDGADALMSVVHTAARTIEHAGAMTDQELARSVFAGPRRSGSVTDLGGGIRLEDGYIRVSDRVSALPSEALKLLKAHAETAKPLDRPAFGKLKLAFSGEPFKVWDRATRDAFLDLLDSARPEGALELLDHAHGWEMLMPEWSRIRGRAQHDPYHRYTVDGHSFITVGMVTWAIAHDPPSAAAAEHAGDLRPLLLAALLHDIGKGSGRDHSLEGERMARSICARMDLDPDASEEVALLVRHHLLLSDTATRRDLDDGAVIESLANTLGDPRIVRMLFILSQADGRATGREAWTDWKASLVAELYKRVVVALETGEKPQRSDVSSRARELDAFDPVLATSAGHLLGTLPPSYLAVTEVQDIADDLRLLLHPPVPGRVTCHVVPGWEEEHMAVTVCVVDRPGALARTAGVLALHRLSVLTARAYSTTNGLALERFVVASHPGADLDRLRADIAAVYSGRLALDARLERKISDYGARGISRVEVRVLQDESEHSTVLEVRSPDATGLLYALTSAMSALDLDIHVAKIDTLGERVVDVFYVRSMAGGKLDAAQATEVEQAIQHRAANLLS